MHCRLFSVPHPVKVVTTIDVSEELAATSRLKSERVTASSSETSVTVTNVARCDCNETLQFYALNFLEASPNWEC
jgi:hypothetical protein